MRPPPWLSIAGALTLVACGADARDPRPNVLLISLDSVRRDMLGCYGAKFPYANGRSPSPNIDRLAAEGVRIEDARSSTSWTLPAHATLFTGEPEIVHGVEQDGQRLPDDLPTIAERLRAQGYRTSGIYSGPYLDPRFGFGRGFERYQAGYGPELAAAAKAASAAIERVHALEESESREQRYAVLEANADAERVLEIASHRDSSSRTVSDLALAELDAAAQDSRPFFLFAHYFDPHYDYVPPPPFDRAFDPDYKGSIDGRDFARRIGGPPPSARDVEHLRALHAGELAWTDSQIGRVLGELDRLGLADNTLVVVVSDHGDEFLEHGGLGHRRTLYEEVVDVPVILRWRARENGLDWTLRISGIKQWESLAWVAPIVLGYVEPIGSPQSPLLDAPPEDRTLGRLVLNPTGKREDVRVLESFCFNTIKILRERSLGPAAVETLRWIDRWPHRDERESDWSSDFDRDDARDALTAFRSAYARLTARRKHAPLADKTDDLLAAFRGLGYAGEEARVGAIASDELVLPPPGQ